MRIETKWREHPKMQVGKTCMWRPHCLTLTNMRADGRHANNIMQTDNANEAMHASATAIGPTSDKKPHGVVKFHTLECSMSLWSKLGWSLLTRSLLEWLWSMLMLDSNCRGSVLKRPKCTCIIVNLSVVSTLLCHNPCLCGRLCLLNVAPLQLCFRLCAVQ